MGLFEALFLGQLQRRDRPPVLDLERWELGGIKPGSPEHEVGRALGRPSSWWATRKGRWLYPAFSLWVTCDAGKVDGIEVDLTGTVGALLGGAPRAFATIRRPGGGEGPPSLEEAKQLFPGVHVSEDVDEVVLQLHREGVGLDLDYDVEEQRLARVALYLDPDQEAQPIFAKDGAKGA